VLTELAGSSFGWRSSSFFIFLGARRSLMGLGGRKVGFGLLPERSGRVGLRQRGYALRPPRLLGFLITVSSRRLGGVSIDRKRHGGRED